MTVPTSDLSPVAGPSLVGAELPNPPADVVAAAREVPEHWLTVVDPGWTGDDIETGGGDPPPWALIGAWRTDATGVIVEWRSNDAHRPSPRALGWPDPTDPLDGLAQRVATGYAPVELLIGVLASSDVVVLVDAEGRPVVTTVPDGGPAVPVYSSEDQAEATGVLARRVVSVDRLLAEVGGADAPALLLNPGGAAVLALDAGPIAARLSGGLSTGVAAD